MIKYDDLPRLAAPDGEAVGAIDVDRVDWPVRYRLARPIETAAATQLDEIELREPTVADLEVAARQKAPMAQKVTIIAHLAEMSPDDVRRLRTRDYARIVELIEAFL